jgi:hypothetical protein
MTMAPVSRLGKQIAEVTAALERVGARYALIGGLALASHHVIRATQDVDLLTDIEKADEIEAELIKLGYHQLHRSTDAGNYARNDERVDLLYAHGPIARRLLAGAKELKTSLGDLRVISLEGIGLMNSFKKSVEQPFANAGGIQSPPIRHADPFLALDDLMAAVETLCPIWPQRDTFINTGTMLL